MFRRHTADRADCTVGGIVLARKKRKTCYSGIGGQAVLEGVMMKNKDIYAVAVRKSDGEIVVNTQEYVGVLNDSFLKKVPFIRGVFNFIDSLVLGMKALNYSANFFEDEEAKESGADKVLNKVSGGRAEQIFMAITLVFSVALSIGVFIALPYYLSTLFGKYVRNRSLLNIIEGAIRIAIFLLYVLLISLMKDIRRVYMYHGAEHKCINCLERGRALYVRNVMRCSRQHRRCGTSFLLFVMFVSIILFFFITVTNPVYRVVLRIALIPVVAGISYELIRFAGKHDNVLVRILSAPGMLLQRLTTREPSEEMVEVAIQSVEAVFDWREYLKENFNYDVAAEEAAEAEAKARAQAEDEEEAAERTDRERAETAERAEVAEHADRERTEAAESAGREQAGVTERAGRERTETAERAGRERKRNTKAKAEP